MRHGFGSLSRRGVAGTGVAPSTRSRRVEGPESGVYQGAGRAGVSERRPAFGRGDENSITLPHVEKSDPKLLRGEAGTKAEQAQENDCDAAYNGCAI